MSKLIGTGPNQVPSNADLGTAAFMDATHFLLSKGSSLSAISSIIPQTAVDLFVYDTTKDSDGGAWRKRVKNTTWYNETLNTPTRGSRRDFPVVAVIVVRSDKITIFDGDDPALPMWMVFEFGPDANNETLLRYGQGYSVAAKNGTFIFGVQDCPVELNFISEQHNLWHAGGLYGFTTRNGIIDRNKYIQEPLQLSSSTTKRILHTTGWDVAITVRANAPVDPTTGLHIPTIAIAGPEGVSIVKEDKTVVWLYQDHATRNSVGSVDFDSETGAVLWTTDYNGSTYWYKLNVNQVPSSNYQTPSSYVGYQEWNREVQMGGNTTVPHVSGGYDTQVNTATRITNFRSAGGNGRYAWSSGHALDIMQEEPSTSLNSSRVCYISSNYNTGWLHGDNRFAGLNDTNAEHLSQGNLVTNGQFDSNVNSWTGSNSTLTHNSSNNKLLITGTAATGHAYQEIGMIAGQTYVISGEIGFGSTFGAGFAIYNGSTTTNVVAVSRTGDGSGFYAGTYTATVSGVHQLRLTHSVSSGSGFTVYYDDIRVGLAEYERSPSKNALQAPGIVRKTPVATGADLVGYSFPDGGSKLEVHNANFNIGTGNFFVNMWVKYDDSGVEQYIFDYRRADSVSAIFWYINGSGSHQIGATGGSQQYGNNTLPTNQWTMLSLIREGSTWALYENGGIRSQSRGDISGASADLDNGDYNLAIGGGVATNLYNCTSEISLVRVSKNTPTLAQLQQIYEDEKVLFQENAKCTLYGSSDSVLAIGYDEQTSTLHAGTSGGRSDFQGLRRVGYNTLPVTAALSANDGFIIED